MHLAHKRFIHACRLRMRMSRLKMSSHQHQAKRAAPPSNESADEGPSTSALAADGIPQYKKPKFSKLGKDPGVSTEFLPDKDRELQEEELRQRLKKVCNAELLPVSGAIVVYMLQQQRAQCVASAACHK